MNQAEGKIGQGKQTALSDQNISLYGMLPFLLQGQLSLSDPLQGNVQGAEATSQTEMQISLAKGLLQQSADALQATAKKAEQAEGMAFNQALSEAGSQNTKAGISQEHPSFLQGRKQISVQSAFHGPSAIQEKMKLSGMTNVASSLRQNSESFSVIAAKKQSDVQQPVLRAEQWMEQVSAKKDVKDEQPADEKQNGLAGGLVSEVHGKEQTLMSETAQKASRAESAGTAQEVSAPIQVAKAAVKALKEGLSEYHIKLKPEGLGEVTVTMVAKDKALTLNIRTDAEATKELILGRIGELRSELSANDYQIRGLNVEVGTNGQGNMNFFASSQEHGSRTFAHHQPDARQNAPEIMPPEDLRQTAMHNAAKNGRISYRV